MCIQGASFGWGLVDIPGASQVEEREHRRPNDKYGLLLVSLLLHDSLPGMRPDVVCFIVVALEDADLIVGAGYFLNELQQMWGFPCTCSS